MLTSFRLFFISHAGLPHGQEKSGNQEKLRKITKVRKSQVKMGFFEKSQKLDKIYKSIRFFQFKFTKFIIFKSLRMVEN